MRNYLKYIVIGKIKTDREFKVYGDEGWKNVCPEVYHGSLNNKQIEKLNSESNHLYLLINPSYSYLDASGPLYDMAMRGLPFVNFAPVFKTDTFAGMRHIEYDLKTVNDLVNDYHSHFNNECLWALQEYRNILESSADDIGLILTDHTPNGTFAKHLAEHEQIINQEVSDYLSENKGFLKLCYKRFLQ